MLIFDDVFWSYQKSPSANPDKNPEILEDYTREQIETEQIKRVIDTFMETDEEWERIGDIKWQTGYRKIIPDRIPFLFQKSLLKYNTARIDLKNFGSEDNSVEIIFNSDSKSQSQFPNWFKTEQGDGLVISSDKNSLDLKIKCIEDGELKIWLRGLDIRDKDNKRIPIYINYTKFVEMVNPI